MRAGRKPGVVLRGGAAAGGISLEGLDGAGRVNDFCKTAELWPPKKSKLLRPSIDLAVTRTFRTSAPEKSFVQVALKSRSLIVEHTG